MSKKWYASKTLWINVIGGIAMIAQGIAGKEIISYELQGSILAGINMVLRIITKEQITW